MNSKLFQLGLKLWSSNTSLLDKVNYLYQNNIITYLELYIVPESYEASVKIWKKAKLPIIIHAPNESILSIGITDKFAKNMHIFSVVQKFADDLNPSKIIVHPDTGELQINIENLHKFNDFRICLENMPYFSLHNEGTLNGSNFLDLEKILSSTGYNFCLDLGHAIIAANNLKIDYMSFIHQFMKLKPTMFHLNDGRLNSTRDSHLHFGDGDFPIQKILKMIPPSSQITLETPKNILGDLNDFVEDIKYLESII